MVVELKAGLVNNMPDAAFADTERQFLSLLHDGAGANDRGLSVTLHTMDGIGRSPGVKEEIARRYRPLSDLYRDPPDLLVITGSNPVETDITREPYWTQLDDLLGWATEQVRSVLTSCLSAHAALKIFDNVDRVRLDSKVTGVFPQTPMPDHPLVARLEAPVVLPHSRLNDVPTTELVRAGYDIALASCDDGAGWSVATRIVTRTRLVLVQGHPEYDAASLIREYQRDARRFVTGERPELPCLPVAATEGEDMDALVELQEALAGGRQDPALVDGFPFPAVMERARRRWEPVARQIYTNWLSGRWPEGAPPSGP